MAFVVFTLCEIFSAARLCGFTLLAELRKFSAICTCTWMYFPYNFKNFFSTALSPAWYSNATYGKSPVRNPQVPEALIFFFVIFVIFAVVFILFSLCYSDSTSIIPSSSLPILSSIPSILQLVSSPRDLFLSYLYFILSVLIFPCRFS